MEGSKQYLSHSEGHLQHFNLTILSFNINVGGGGDDGLFGWSLAHHRGSLYVGAPVGGKVFKCDQFTTSTSRVCISTNSPGLQDDSWFGGTMAGSNDNLYSCAFRYKWQSYDVRRTKLGRCYSLSGNKWNKFFDFTGRFRKSSNSPWFYRGIYGFSTTVDDAGDLGKSSFLGLLD